MDCNSYSYAPHMLDGENLGIIASVRNDTIDASITHAARGNEDGWTEGYEVYAYSYDGIINICEFFATRTAAETLYNYIVNTGTPTRKEIRNVIRNARQEERKRAQ